MKGDSMTERPQTGRVITSFEEVAYYNMILVESLVQLLAEKGLLETEELFKRVKKIKAETGINCKPKN
jgi:hypothetical protein